MARLEREAFAVELRCVYIAAKLQEAKSVETLLATLGVDYAVDVEEIGTTLFGSTRQGAVFYVADGQAAYTSAKLAEAGLGEGVILTEDFSGERRES